MQRIVTHLCYMVALSTPVRRPWSIRNILATGRLLEVYRCAHGSGASITATWESVCGRAPLPGLEESSSFLALSWTAETATFRRTRFEHGADEFLCPLRAPSSSPRHTRAPGARSNLNV